MTDDRMAGPAARKRATLFLLVGTCVGILLILGFERYRVIVHDWMLDEPETTAQHVRLAVLILAALTAAPLFGFAVFVWSFGEKAVRAREFPAPGFHVIRDTPIITGDRAIARGRLLKAIALGCGIASVAAGLLLWRLAGSFSGHVF